jgi:hypothetical protein
MTADAQAEPTRLSPGDDPGERLLRALETMLAPVRRTSDRRRPGAGVNAGGADQPLRAEVRAYVDHLKHAGATPERVVVSVKELVRPTLLRTTPSDRRTDASALLSRIVEWSVREYYRVG